MGSPQAYIRFEERAVEDRAASIEQGHYVAKDEDYIIIVPPGDGKTVLEQKVNKRHKIRYNKEYKAWKEGREIPIEGTSIKDWSQTSPAIVENLLRANVRTVEQLAQCNESTLERIGMGSRNLQNKARAWLEASEGPGKMSEAMAEITRRMDDMDLANTEKDDLIARLQKENESLRNGEGQAEDLKTEGENEDNASKDVYRPASGLPAKRLPRKPGRKPKV